MNPISRIVGLVAAMLFTLGGYLFDGGNLGNLIEPGELFVVLFVPLALVTASFGFSGLKEAISLPGKFLRPKSLGNEVGEIYKSWIKTTYLISFLMFALGITFTMQFIDTDRALFGEKIAATFSPFVYAIIICEFFLRPTVNYRTEFCH